jgi:trk system potassium uptake protein TrkH
VDPSDRESARSRLAAARLAGAGTIAVLGQLAVDMPDGYFGPAETVTSFGLAYTISLSTAVLIGVWLFLRQSRSARLVPWLVLPVGVGLFLPAVPSDPIIAGGVMLWNLALLGLVELGSSTHALAGEDRLTRWLVVNGAAVRHVAMVALVVSVLVLGYGVGQRLGAMLLCAALVVVAAVLSVPLLVLLFRRGSRIVPLGGAAALAAAAAAALAVGPEAALAVMTGYLVLVLVQLIASTPTFDELVEHFLAHPGLLVLISFAVIIAVGTVLLSLPAAAPEGDRIAPVDALFTATSAACVTGLIVLDTPNDFSTFGHVVILLLIQVGGLNIMVLSAFAAVLLGRNLGLRGEAALGDVLDLSSAAAAYRLVAFIVVGTMIVESAGAIALGYGWSAHGASPGEAAWKGLFHAVSAFCNAGFALQSDSLQMFRTDPLMLVTFSGLIVLGGLGFAVLAGLWWRLRGAPRAELGVHTHIVIRASAVLIVVGWLLYLGFEWNRTLAGLEPADRIVNALFQSVTTRTAGFNSVALDGLQPATLLLMMVLMFIGASPGGTGGGIKTTTAVVLLAAIPALATRRAQVVLRGRRLPLSTVFRGTAIGVVGLVLVVTTAGLLLATHRIPFESVLFEAVSAFGTVGLSLGATASLDGFGKIIVALAMLAGRIGPLTIALLLGQARETRLSYPEARIMVG